MAHQRADHAVLGVHPLYPIQPLVIHTQLLRALVRPLPQAANLAPTTIQDYDANHPIRIHAANSDTITAIFGGQLPLGRKSETVSNYTLYIFNISGI